MIAGKGSATTAFGFRFGGGGFEARALRLAGLLALGLAACGWVAIGWWESVQYQVLAERGRDRLVLYGAGLKTQLDNALNVPLVLSDDPDVVALLSSPKGPEQDARAQTLSRRLEIQSEKVGVSALYVLDRQGLTLAASNWNLGPGSFVGRNFDFRPYFIEAMKLHPGRYYGIGTTSHLAGYFVAIPVIREGRALGAVVAKSSLGALERGWAGGGEPVLVTDENGIVFLTNRPEWRYRSLGQVDPERLDRIRASRQYGDIEPIAFRLRESGLLTQVDGHDYVAASQAVSDSQSWTLHILMEVDEVRARLRDLVLLATASVLLAAAVSYGLIHRVRLQGIYKRKLEREVDERTAELVESNFRLQTEVTERQRAETMLREKQDELVQAAKLAALGQMAAGIVHEVNQPVTAIRAYADNVRTLLDRGAEAVARANLSEIVQLTERIGCITGQLKQFARKSPGQRRPVALDGVVEGALALLSARLEQEGVRVEWTAPGAEIRAWADEVRLQQVVVNLLRNALDAMRQSEERRLVLRVQAKNRHVMLLVQDSGPGIAEDVMPRLFDPFFTTKPDGEGLGLGLSISEGILRDMGGMLSAANHPRGGAIFTVTLRRADER